ncbi:MAG: NAD(P)/FAD-dependent oxidoreductase [Myxococcales bacterium]|nr:NAD(P)/FAD-dependent oxidoreductase [Myxococcales bacterium]
MSTELDTDVAVIGAGVIGLAVAERLSRPGRAVVVVEKNPTPGMETTSRNSQVVHAGMYYPTGTLKAALCVRGNASLLEWCRAHAVPHALVGKLIVATSADEEPELDAIFERGRANGVGHLERVDVRFVRGKEPEVAATAALWSPHTGVIDAQAFVGSLLEQGRAQGVVLALRHRLQAAATRSDGFGLEVLGPEGDRISIRARRVVNAAGLHADTVAALPGIDVDTAGYRQHFVKGHYFRVRARGRVRHLVYPVPVKDLAGLGVHVTVGLDGDVRLGPDVKFLDGRQEDYDVPEELAESFWRGASRYLPWLRPELLAPDQAGIRPKLSSRGGGFRDFVIAEESSRGLSGWINLLGIESPGLTCALEIAAEVERLLA